MPIRLTHSNPPAKSGGKGCIFNFSFLSDDIFERLSPFYSFLSEKKKKRFVSKELGNKGEKVWAANANLCLTRYQFWFVGSDALSEAFYHDFDRYVVLCRKYAQISINLFRIKSIFHQISPTSSRNWIFQTQKTRSAEMSGSYHNSLIRRDH